MLQGYKVQGLSRKVMPRHRVQARHSSACGHVFMSLLPAAFHAEDDVRDSVHDAEEVVHDLLIEILRLDLLHRVEEAFHLLPEHVAGIRGGNLKHLPS